MNRNKALQAHLAMLMACAFWGLMAPLGKDAMTKGMDGFTLVTFRVMGGALLFWLASLFLPKEPVSRQDKWKLAGAAVLGLVCNQCCYTIGLSLTSPINASIVTTSMPIFAMLLSFIILKEPLTSKKIMGVALGCSGAVVIVLSSATSNGKGGHILGDLLCMTAQCSYALYLSLCNKLVKRYSAMTVNRWMFLWATVLICPFSITHLSAINWHQIPLQAWWEAAYVVVFCTFIAYICIMMAQRILRPTVVACYNYLQPVVAVAVSLLLGLAVFRWYQAVAVALVFTGVWLVVTSRSAKDVRNNPHRAS